MIITFFGHSQLSSCEAFVEQVLSAIREHARGESVLFYLGGYGDFGAVSLAACRAFKETHPDSRLIFVTPYIDERYLKNRELYLRNYDEILYPEIESALPRFAISKRNKWMVKKADFVIACVDHAWGGAANALKYAISCNKPFLNLGTYPFKHHS